MSTPTRPGFTFPGLDTTELNAWPQEEDGEPEKMVRMLAFERIPVGVAASTHTRLGVGNDFTTIGKVVWGRVDERTGELWVRFDHLVATTRADRVWREARWLTFTDFQARFPRSQMPLNMAAKILTNLDCTRPNPNRHGDDFEEMFLVNNPLDRLDQDNELDFSQQARVIDQARTKAFWWSKYGRR